METIEVHLPQRYGTDKHQLFAHIALWEFVGMLVKQNGVSDIFISFLKRRSEQADILYLIVLCVQVVTKSKTKKFFENFLKIFFKSILL